MASHPGLIAVERGTGAFSTRAVCLQNIAPGALVTKITGSTIARARAYTSVQASKSTDIELNSDLVFCNHSCTPSVIFDMSAMEVRAVSGRPLRKGDELTFFYPSTEWDMAQPFKCDCSGDDGVCIGTVRGAKYLDVKILRKYWLNAHIVDLLAEKRAT